MLWKRSEVDLLFIICCLLFIVGFGIWDLGIGDWGLGIEISLFIFTF
jgi:hypothetical protein